MRRTAPGYAKSVSPLLSRVQQFHYEMGQLDPLAPVDLTPEQRMKRARLIAEEAAELVVALVGTERAADYFAFFVERENARHCAGVGSAFDLPAIADGCIDLQVVCAGTLSEAGIADMPLIDAVMDANDAKVGGGVDENQKFRKPPGWQPPDIAGLLRAQGWKP